MKVEKTNVYKLKIFAKKKYMAGSSIIKIYNPGYNVIGNLLNKILNNKLNY